MYQEGQVYHPNTGFLDPAIYSPGAGHRRGERCSAKGLRHGGDTVCLSLIEKQDSFWPVARQPQQSPVALWFGVGQEVCVGAWVLSVRYREVTMKRFFIVLMVLGLLSGSTRYLAGCAFKQVMRKVTLQPCSDPNALCR